MRLERSYTLWGCAGVGTVDASIVLCKILGRLLMHYHSCNQSSDP